MVFEIENLMFEEFLCYPAARFKKDDLWHKRKRGGYLVGGRAGKEENRQTSQKTKMTQDIFFSWWFEFPCWSKLVFTSCNKIRPDQSPPHFDLQRPLCTFSPHGELGWQSITSISIGWLIFPLCWIKLLVTDNVGYQTKWQILQIAILRLCAFTLIRPILQRPKEKLSVWRRKTVKRMLDGRTVERSNIRK